MSRDDPGALFFCKGRRHTLRDPHTTHTHTRTHAHTHTHACTHTQARMHTHTSTHAHTFVQAAFTSVAAARSSRKRTFDRSIADPGMRTLAGPPTSCWTVTSLRPPNRPPVLRTRTVRDPLMAPNRVVDVYVTSLPSASLVHVWTTGRGMKPQSSGEIVPKTSPSARMGPPPVATRREKMVRHEFQAPMPVSLSKTCEWKMKKEG